MIKYKVSDFQKEKVIPMTTINYLVISDLECFTILQAILLKIRVMDFLLRKKHNSKNIMS